jgi:hypothetical protein
MTLDVTARFPLIADMTPGIGNPDNCHSSESWDLLFPYCQAFMNQEPASMTSASEPHAIC